MEHVLAATIEPPESSRIDAAVRTLEMLGAMDSAENLTSLGRVLLQIPVDAAIGKLCLYGSFFRCLDSALTLAAVLTNRDPFLSPPLKKEEADAIKDSWSPLAFRSDPLAIVAAFNAWSAMDDRGDYSQATRFCGDNFLSKPTMLQIKQVKKSLLQSLEQAGVVAVSAGGQVRHIGRRGVVPPELNEHGGSLPLLAALIAMASAPNFALRTSEKTCRTAQDKVSPARIKVKKLIVRPCSSTLHLSIRAGEKPEGRSIPRPRSTRSRSVSTPLARRREMFHSEAIQIRASRICVLSPGWTP